MNKIKTIIMGAAGRDFHNFNTVYRDNELYNVIAFTATQIPNIHGRKYPAILAGKLYPEGIPIHDESEVAALIKKHNIDEVVFSYSDISSNYVMERASVVMAAGAHFKVLGARDTMIASTKPVIAVVAVRTGSGKSQTSRKVAEILHAMGKKVVAIRHPMPYGDLSKQIVQRFATVEDLHTHNCTIEEMEEYEPHITSGTIIYAGVDYEKILREAEKEADVIIWDGGNNDMPFYKPNLNICVADPHRPGHELTYYPGATNLRMADVIVINKVDSADRKNVDTVRDNIRKVNNDAIIVEGASPISVDDASVIEGKKVLVIEDGPTLTHGEMSFGAGVLAAQKFGASEIIDPRPYAVHSIAATYKKYPSTGTLLPAMGYGDEQLKDLEETIRRVPCEVVIIGTPIDLRRVITIDKPATRVRYDLEEITKPNLTEILKNFFEKK
jgi:predicted GTPase